MLLSTVVLIYIVCMFLNHKMDRSDNKTYKMSRKRYNNAILTPIKRRIY